MIYQRISLPNTPLGDPGPLPDCLVGLSDATLADMSWADPLLGFSGQGFLPVIRKISAIAFKQRLHPDERIGIRQASGSDAVIYDFLDLLDTTNTVDLDDPDTVAGIEYIVSKGLLTQERADEIRED